MDNNLQLFSFEGQSVLDSRNVAEMIGKRHDHLVRDIDRYIEDIEESPKLGNGSTTAFFIEKLLGLIKQGYPKILIWGGIALSALFFFIFIYSLIYL
jgi:phage regulator Rha-like protein